MSAPPSITAEECRNLAKTRAVFLDAESPDVWEARSGEVRRLSPGAVPDFLRSLAKDAPIIVYTSHPQLDSSALVANAFRQQGYTNVKALTGGTTAWRRAGFTDRVRHVFPSHW